MKKNNIKKKIEFLMIAVIILFPNFSPTFSLLQQESLVTINGFENFQLVENSLLVYSEKNNDEIIFSYDGSSSLYPLYEVYTYEFPQFYKNFEINCKVDLSMNDLSSMATFTVGGSSDTSYIGQAGIWDCQRGISGAYVVIGFPNKTKDLKQTNFGSIGLTKTITLHLYKEDNHFEGIVRDETDSITLLSASWTSGFNELLKKLELIFYTGDLIGTSIVKVYSYSAYFSNSLITNINSNEDSDYNLILKRIFGLYSIPLYLIIIGVISFVIYKRIKNKVKMDKMNSEKKENLSSSATIKDDDKIKQLIELENYFEKGYSFLLENSSKED